MWRCFFAGTLVMLWLSGEVMAEEETERQKCKHSGHRFVSDFIQFQCFVDPENKLVDKPIGCVPSNTANGQVILPGLSFTGKHFRYSCYRRADESLLLKITHCVDSAGSMVALGEYFMQKNGKDEHESMECVGDEMHAKKVVFKWSKCRLKSGELLTEGNFVTENVPSEQLRSSLQTAEVIACRRDAENVTLVCTACVAVNGNHIAVSAYSAVDGQWTQCRRTNDGCRLINVTNEYVDCRHEGELHENGETFRSKSGQSVYTCDFGVVTKQGCIINEELVTVGDVRYVEERPLLCELSDEIATFGSLRGCQLEGDSDPKRFMETWRDGDAKKRCSWSTDKSGDVHSEVVSYACIHDENEVPLNKVVQMPGGVMMKCAPLGSDRIEMRALTDAELDEYLKRKTSRLSLVEYFGSGGRGSVADAPLRDTVDEGCTDFLPFCSQLKGYCAQSATAAVDSGLLIEAYGDHARMLQNFERLAGLPHDTKRPNGCDDQLAPFRKFQMLVELSCPQSCRKCVSSTKREHFVRNLERTAHC